MWTENEAYMIWDLLRSCEVKVDYHERLGQFKPWVIKKAILEIWNDQKKTGTVHAPSSNVVRNRILSIFQRSREYKKHGLPEIKGPCEWCWGYKICDPWVWPIKDFHWKIAYKEYEALNQRGCVHLVGPGLHYLESAIAIALHVNGEPYALSPEKLRLHCHHCGTHREASDTITSILSFHDNVGAKYLSFNLGDHGFKSPGWFANRNMYINTLQSKPEPEPLRRVSDIVPENLQKHLTDLGATDVTDE
ncbi:MAG: hypothetical protein ACXABY_35485 [Candidatus Thorarchaeota archaeon]|jgi:hypothetical protein